VVSPFSLADKTAIVTGGRRGIGRAIALALAGAGADVALCDRVVDDGELEEAAAGIKKLGRRSIAVQTDITQKAEVDSLVQRTLAELGAIDILVNNAAMNIRAPLLELEEKGWDRVINTDLKGYYLCSQAAGKVMVKQKRGNIINIASTAAMDIVKTRFSQPLWDDPKILKKIESEIPLGRLAEPEDITGAVLFLASESSAYVTGHTIVVDGGSIA